MCLIDLIPFHGGMIIYSVYMTYIVIHYIIFRKDRSNRSDPRGGVLIAVKSALNPIMINLDTIYECVVVDILQNMVRIRLCCIYRPPSMSDAETKTFFDKLTPALSSSFNLCPAGDFNVPNIDWNLFFSD